LRWNHEIFGYVSPTTVLSIAEEAGLGMSLGQWIIRQAIRQVSVWDSHALDGLSISINLSPSQLSEDQYIVNLIKSELKRYHISAERVEFELTENDVIEKTEPVFEKLKALREMGSDISIDDFGMGHSSLKYLYEFYANVVKLDASLVQNLPRGADHVKIVSSILDLCDTLGVDVIAEGVETEEQLMILRELGGKCFQGYYFSRALPSEQFIRFAREHGVAQADDKCRQ
jgi:EAL domain-containing protein (putative c-di-GMP-specific phosphodiesterase class I)